jgi:hypothetical protein
VMCCPTRAGHGQYRRRPDGWLVLRQAQIHDATEATPLMAYTVFMRIASASQGEKTPFRLSRQPPSPALRHGKPTPHRTLTRLTPVI